MLRRVLMLVAFFAYHAPAVAQPAAWSTYAGDAQHTALSAVGSQPLQAIRWQTAVDLAPQYSGNDLLIHYGSPAVTSRRERNGPPGWRSAWKRVHGMCRSSSKPCANQPPGISTR